jgi:hypothetical protein
MNKITIFQREIQDGIAEAVKAQASVAYCSPATLHKGDLGTITQNVINKKLRNKIVAENKGEQDLYYLESVLVSTGWNKNDDVFTAKATWDARYTPEDKQFNYMHDENDIIGHITGCYVLDQNGQKVESSQQDPPDKFDIITQAVLYNSWTQDENRDRMQQIIAEIKDGKWFVSMECLFAGFDYALIDSNGNAQLVERNEDSAFLTKHLRSYGGTGEYEGYKVGRALNRIAFSGKGLVRKPANPRSIILNNSTAEFDIKKTVLCNLIEGENQMSLEKELDQLKAQLAEANQAEEAKSKEFASKIQAFETEVSKKGETISLLEEQVKATQAKIAELEDALTASQTELAEAAKQMDEMKKKEKNQKRMASLIEAGFETQEAENTLASFEALSDDSFESVVALMKSKYTKKQEEMKKHEQLESPQEENKEEMKAEQVEATAQVFENVESTEAALIESTEVDELQQTKASISSWLENNVLSK